MLQRFRKLFGAKTRRVASYAIAGSMLAFIMADDIIGTKSFSANVINVRPKEPPMFSSLDFAGRQFVSLDLDINYDGYADMTECILLPYPCDIKTGDYIIRTNIFGRLVNIKSK
jgi:hypothetical protein